MATVIKKEINTMMEIGAAHLKNRRFFFPLPLVPVCHRCGGLMVDESCMDLWNTTGELEFVARRCVQCGEIVDPVILRNRDLQHRSGPTRPHLNN